MLILRHRLPAFPNRFLAVITAAVCGLGVSPIALSQSHERGVQAVGGADDDSIGQMIEEETACGGEVVATALLRVSRRPIHILDRRAAKESEADWKAFIRTNIELLKSQLVVTRALANPDIASLSLISKNPDAAGWLRAHLEVDLLEDSQILAISLKGAKEDSDELRQIVNAVLSAYFATQLDAQSQDLRRDFESTQRTLQVSRMEVERLLTHYRTAADEAGSVVHSRAAQVQQQIDLRRLDQIDSELLRLEDELARLNGQADSSDKSAVQAVEAHYPRNRIADLERRRGELEKRIVGRCAEPPELAHAKREVDRELQIVEELAYELDTLKFEGKAPSRIELFQQAMIEMHDARR